MSIETILLLALFTLLPLMEHALRKWREARERAERRARGLPPVPPPLPIPQQVPRVPPGHVPVPVEPSGWDEPVERKVVVRAPKAPRPRTPRVAVAVARTLRPVHVRDELRDPRAVRRGIVLMTVLGPCRANAPHDIPAASRVRRAS